MTRAQCISLVLVSGFFAACAGDRPGTEPMAGAASRSPIADRTPAERVPSSQTTIVQGGSPASGSSAIASTILAPAAIDSTRSGTVLGTTTTTPGKNP